MATAEEVIKEGIASILKEPNRDFEEFPLTPEEVQTVIEHCITEAADPALDESLRQFYFECVRFLKKQMFYN